MNLALAEMYLQGVSTRKVIEVLQKLVGRRSASRARKSAFARRCWMRACTPGVPGPWMRHRM